MVGPGARRDHHAVHDPGAVDELTAGGLDVRLKRRVGGGAPPVEHSGRRQHQRCVAELGHRLLVVEEVTDDPLDVGVVADVLRRATAGNDQSDVVAGLDVGERQIGLPGVAGLLRVGVEAVDEVVDDELKLLLLGGRHVDLVSLLQQPLVGVHHLEGLRGIAGQQQHLGHMNHSPPINRALDRRYPMV
jgi:hypothetical protein